MKPLSFLDSAITTWGRISMRFVLALFIFLAFAALISETPEKLWEIFQLSFVLGALVLSMSTRTLLKGHQHDFPRLGFVFVLSGILILFGLGLQISIQQQYLSIPEVSGGVFIFIGVFALAFGMADLFFEFGGAMLKK
ncbi:MAG: hypothetical protein WCV62_03305 [Candidatus Peribacteraceae bacterium]